MKNVYRIRINRKYSMHKFNQGTRHETRKGLLRRLGPQHLEERLNEISDVQSLIGKDSLYFGIGRDHNPTWIFARDGERLYVAIEGVPGGNSQDAGSIAEPGDTPP
jgi:hypothetical protein